MAPSRPRRAARRSREAPPRPRRAREEPASPPRRRRDPSTPQAENSDPAAAARPAASVKEITKQIQAIIRQITASVTFLPLLEEACAFDLLVYTRKRAQVPGEWEDTDPQYIADGTDVKLRSFTTSVHTVDAAVSYKESE